MKRVLSTLSLQDNTAVKLVKMVDKDGYISKLVEKDLNRIIKFDNGFTFDIETCKIYNIAQDEVSLTKTQEKLFILLIAAKGKTVSIEDIADMVWKGKNMTRFSLRNQIKIIRDKTFYELIKSSSNIGYSINFKEGV